ncbi:hypothetical protein DGMP_33270 [Desulfomarina profundi]|uniref:Vitamin K epoxide reductase domain-containing protein n=1 Tax=Desulfomarina profundi TaxID=2772557 RepID=A0A8D5FVX0_9BACT|nr:hypothetical protein [Desulfomarina profundi]BCL62634.1 hypothetical protein DGMP_33270 [Desulfomarina profundi]
MVRVIISSLAALLTGIQALLIFFGSKGICLNDGCAVVDSFTRVSPFYFNLAGCFYFLFLSWCFLQVRKKKELFRVLAGLVLFGGIAAEGVLIFFQYVVLSTFCSYCLIVCSAIILLTVLSGLKQVAGGAVLFFSVFLALSSLDFKASAGGNVSLGRGSYAQIPGEKDKPSLYLFFSETCPHCENVIAVMDEKRSCTIRFNPIDKVKDFSFSGSSRLPEYDPLVNVSFLKKLDLTEIPVLVVQGREKIQIFKGESRIIRYLRENCGSEVEYGGTVSGTEDGGYSYLPFLQKEEGCSVAEDCDGESGEQEK